MNKKYLPIILLGLGVLAVIGVIASVAGGGKPTPTATPIAEEIAPEVPFDQRPYVTLVPRSDSNTCVGSNSAGHWLKLSIAGVNRIAGATSLDYILEYRTADDVNQGVPGTVKLTGITTIDRDLLLGSESSGKCRYDVGVETGTLTLRFRDASGKLLGKLSTEFHLQDNKSASLTSADGAFTYTLDKAAKKGYFVSMNTLGVPEGVKGDIAKGPYGVFTSETTEFPGKVTLEGANINRWGESKWNVLKSSVSSDLGVFLSTK